tara:strand:- start:306 stop:470 length:165 start_codon:yes stop_codon:yes gene_type:complete
MLTLGIIGVVLFLLGLIMFVLVISRYGEATDFGLKVVVFTTIVGAVCFYLSIVL